MIVLFILLFSTLASASVISPEQQTVPTFDSRCSGPLSYTSQIIKARVGGISEDDLVNDIQQAELNGLLSNMSPKMITDMVEIIHMVYAADMDSIEGVQKLYLEVNGWCSSQMPPEKLEDRRWYDEDGDGYPDYDGEGDPIITYDI